MILHVILPLEIIIAKITKLLRDGKMNLGFLCKKLKKEAIHNVLPPYDMVRFNYFTFSTIALKASGLLTARSARTLRLISMPAL